MSVSELQTLLTAVVGGLAVLVACMAIWRSRGHSRTLMLVLVSIAGVLGVIGVYALHAASRWESLDGQLLAVAATLFAVVAILQGTLPDDVDHADGLE